MKPKSKKSIKGQKKFTFKYYKIFPFEHDCVCHMSMTAHFKDYLNDSGYLVSGLKEVRAVIGYIAYARPKKDIRKMQKVVDKTKKDSITISK